jgi:hypothetical protein
VPEQGNLLTKLSADKCYAFGILPQMRKSVPELGFRLTAVSDALRIARSHHQHQQRNGYRISDGAEHHEPGQVNTADRD